MSDDDIVSSRPVMPPPKAGAASDTGDIVSEHPPAENLPLSNAPDEGFWSGAGKNLATTALKGAAHVPGMAGDLVQMGLGVSASALAKMPWEDRSRQQIHDQWQEGLAASGQRRAAELQTQLNQPGLSDREKNTIKRQLARVAAPPTGEEIYQKEIAPRLGEYTPTSALGRYARAAGEAAIPSVLMPGMGLARGAVSGAGAGLASEAASHEFGIEDPLALFGIGSVGAATPSIPRAVKFGADKIRGGKQLTPAQEKAQAVAAMETFSENPEQAWQRMQERKAAGVPDEPAAQASLDRGHALAQNAIAAQNHPQMMQMLQDERLAQNEAMQKHLQGMGPIGAPPTEISANFLKRRDQLDALSDQAAEALPKGLPGNEAGSAQRQFGQAVADRVRQGLDRLKASIDPTGVLRTWAQPVRDYAASILKEAESRPFKDRSEFADDFFRDKAMTLPDVMKFNDFIDFDQSITGRMQTAKAKGDMAGYNQLRELKGRVKEALKSTAEQQHMAEQQAVSRGEMRPEDTGAARMDDLNKWWAENDAWAKAATGSEHEHSGSSTARGQTAAGDAIQTAPGSTAAARQGDVAAEGGAGSAPGLGSANDAGGLPPTNERTPVQKLSQFNREWGDYKDTYRKGAVGEALQREPAGGGYSKLDADVANKAFASGPKGYEQAQMWLKAAGDNPEGLARLKDIALGRLQAEIKDGKVLDQKALDAYRTKYRDALRAIDEVDPQFSRQFDSAAGAVENVRNFETSEAGKFLGLTSPDTIVAHLGTILKDKAGAERLGQLMQQAGQAPNSEAVIGGLRNAGAKWIEQNFRSADRLPGETGEAVPVFRGAAIRDFINNNRDKLDTLFDPKAVDGMADLANNIDRSKMVQTLQNVQHGSQTAGRLGGIEAQKRMLGKQVAASLAQDAKAHTASAFSGIAAWEMMREMFHTVTGSGDLLHVGGAAGVFAIGKAWERALEKAGVAREAQQHRITDLMSRGFASRDFALALKEDAMNEHGIPNQRTFDNLARALVGAETQQQREQEEGRMGRAAGGRVESLAKRMVEAVNQARKQETGRTKPFLHKDDSLVAHALAIANRSI